MKDVKKYFLGAILAVAAILSFAFIAVACLEPTANVVIDDSSYKEYKVRLYEPEYVMSYKVSKLYDSTVDFEGVSPEVLRLPKGETIKLTVTSKLNCNFEIEGYGISTYILPNTRTELVFNTVKAGSYVYSCNGPRYPIGNVGIVEVY